MAALRRILSQFLGLLTTSQPLLNLWPQLADEMHRMFDLLVLPRKAPLDQPKQRSIATEIGPVAASKALRVISRGFGKRTAKESKTNRADPGKRLHIEIQKS